MSTYILKFIPWFIFLTLGIVSAWQATQINGISFDPLGSKAAPYTFSGLLVILLLVDLFRNGFKESADEISPSFTEILSVFFVLVVSIIYCLAVFQFNTPFSIATMLLVPTVSWLLQSKMSKKIIFTRFIFGALLGLGGELLFTKVFFVDLPTIW
jgi:hypothetical protein